MKKRIIILMFMLVSILPVSAFADELDLPPLNRSRYNVVFGLKKRKGIFYEQEALQT